MLQLLGHILRISAHRDRTEINSELVDAMQDLFHPLAFSIHRCYASDKTTITFDCAGVDAGGKYSRNAYLPDRRYCAPIEQDPLLMRCGQEMSVVLDDGTDGTHRIVVPVIQSNSLLYLIDATLPEDFPADQRVALMGLTEFFGKHIFLLDYGETDTLTGLANRKTFDKHLFEVLGTAAADAVAVDGHRRRGENDATHHWLAVCDIDHFKSINDTHGHLMGDEVLVALAQVMRKSFRFDDQLFRFGGEEFVVVLQPADRDAVLQVFERFRLDVESHVFSRIGHITISTGITQLRTLDAPADTFDRADEALYFAKQHGRNQVALYEALIESGQLAAKTTEAGAIELF